MDGAASVTSGGRADVVVIGAGLHGCSAALHLKRGGLSVIVLEKDYPGRHASGVNAGGVRRLGRALAEVPLSLVSAELWSHIADLVDEDCGFEASGQVKVAETEAEFEQQKQRVAELNDNGFSHEQIIDQSSLREWLPNVSRHCVGGILVESDGHANPFRTVTAFRRKCEALGVSVRSRAPVTRIRRTHGSWLVDTPAGTFEAPVVVNCAGAWGGRVAELLGESPVPLEAQAPMLMISERMPAFVQPVVGAQGRTLSFKQFANGTVLVGGGHRGRAEPETNTTHLDYRQLAINAQTARAIFPIMSRARVVRCWAGIEGVMPDAIPVVGAGREHGVYHAFGFSAHGFQLGPAVGQILGELIVGGDSSVDISPFAIDRFRPG